MFDTIHLVAYGVMIDPIQIILRNSIVKTGKSLTEHGDVEQRFTISDKQIPYIDYHDLKQRLIVHVSIPKFLFGDNVTLVKESDLTLFWAKLSSRLYDLLGIQMNKQDWQVSRLDVCWNFNVGERVEDYIKHLSSKHLGRRRTCLYNQNQTIEFRSKSSSIKFYDKAKECKNGKLPDEIIQKAMGLLRMEVQESSYHLRQYSKERKAVDLLTVNYFKRTILKVEPLLRFAATEMEMSFDWMKKQKITDVERAIGFSALLEHFSEAELKELFAPATYYKRLKLVQQLSSRKQILADLTIDVA